MSSINVESVSHAIAESLEKDEQQWDYLSQLTSSQNGLYNYDANRLTKVKEVSVPKAISDSIHHQNVLDSRHCFGGFFEVINRAYFVVHSSIFLWDYENKERWCCLNQFNDEITAVCLVRAKANMFIDKIRFLLIVATKIEIMLIGIGFANNSTTLDAELEAFPTKYSTSTDNVSVNQIVADCDTQRVFLCCDHGNVYEFEYFYKQNLFGQHCRTCVKSNISDSFTSKLLKSFTFPENNNGSGSGSGSNQQNTRSTVPKQNGIIDLVIHPDIFNTKCLFSLSANGDIHGYVFCYHEATPNTNTAATVSPSSQRQQQQPQQAAAAASPPQPQQPQPPQQRRVMSKMLAYSGKKLWNEIQLQIQQMTDDNQSYFYHRDVRLVKLFAITKYESQRCQLMGVTRDGDRLFFQISSNDALSMSWWNMELCFVRIRAPFLNYQQTQHQQQSSFEPCIQASSPCGIHASACLHHNGVTFMNSVKNYHSHSHTHHHHNNDCLMLLWRNDVETQKSKYGRPQLIESIECDIVSGSSSARGGGGGGGGRHDNLILAMCQVPPRHLPSVLLFSSKELHNKPSAGAKPLVGLSQFALQHVLPAPEFLCLRKHCLVAYRLRRTIDIFKECLLHRNHARILHFVNSIGLIECEVMCLFILLAAADTQHPSSTTTTTATTSTSTTTSVIRSEALSLFQTEVSQHSDQLYQDLMLRLNCPCSKLLSIYLCVSRILRPLWSHTICVVDVAHNHLISARYSLEQLLAVATPLKTLKALLPELTVNVASSTIKEQQLPAVHAWLDQCLQTLHALMALTHCPFSRVYDELSNDDQILLQHMSFEQLLVKESGTALLRNVVHSLTTNNKLSEHHIKQLHTHCPLYFSSAQFVTFLFQSQLSRDGHHPHAQGGGALESALTMLCEVCGDPSFDLQNVCALLMNAAYYTGVVKLVFTLQARLMAQIQELYTHKQHQHQLQVQQHQQLPQQQLLLQVPSASSTSVDAQIVQLKNRVLCAWQQIFECLHRLFVVAEHGAHRHQHVPADLGEHQNRVLALCVQQDNRDFAYKLYEWCLEHNIHLLHKLFTFKPKPKYLENFLGENIVASTGGTSTAAAGGGADGGDDEHEMSRVQQQLQQQQQHERNRRLKELVAFYKANSETAKMVQLLDALTKSSGFTLHERYNFLIEARRATQTLNEKRVQFDPHNVSNDRYNKFAEKANLCKIQLDVLYTLKRKCNAAAGNNSSLCVQDRDLVSLEYKLLNLEQIYEMCKQYELHECCLDCLAFTNDAKVVDYVNRCWCLYIADCIKTQRSQWTQYLAEHFASLVNRYNLQQQPWMFDANEIVFYLNLTNLQTNAQPSDEVVLDILYPNIKQLTYEQLLTVYKHVLARIETPYKVNIARSIWYLIVDKNPGADHPAQRPHAHHRASPLNNPRVAQAQHNNKLLLQSSSTNDLRQDLISNCLSYLQKLVQHQPQYESLLADFRRALSEQYQNK